MKLRAASLVLLGSWLPLSSAPALAAPLADIRTAAVSPGVAKSYLLCDSWGNCWETDPYDNPPHYNHKVWERGLKRGEDYSFGELTTPNALRDALAGSGGDTPY
ncbi:hypothetical protein WOC76_05425 [Methylocystis sp. IM3]|uniref:hypothetical protein n=1 Tax=unclassified Methylocystis TaxID=2625913 RepID=UPI0030F682B7